MATNETKLGKINALFRFLHNRDIDMSNFEQRLMWQKTAYLLKNLGFSSLPTQTWYVRGPYSPTLTTIGYEIYEKDVKPCASLPSNIKQKLVPLQENFATEIQDSEKIELLVSVVYVMKEMGETDVSKIIEWIQERKPWYTPHQIKQMYLKVKGKRELFKF